MFSALWNDAGIVYYIFILRLRDCLGLSGVVWGKTKFGGWPDRDMALQPFLPPSQHSQSSSCPCHHDSCTQAIQATTHWHTGAYMHALHTRKQTSTTQTLNHTNTHVNKHCICAHTRILNTHTNAHVQAVGELPTGKGLPGFIFNIFPYDMNYEPRGEYGTVRIYGSGQPYLYAQGNNRYKTYTFCPERCVIMK